MPHPSERRHGNYDEKRATRLHRRILGTLEIKDAAGQIKLVSREPVEGARIFGLEPTLIVAPPKPIFQAAQLDRFRKGLVQGVTPDFQTDSEGSYADRHDGLSFGSLRYYNIPGFTIHDGSVSTSTPAADYAALKRLEEKTGKPAIELVRTTSVRVFPHADLAEFMHSYALGQLDGSSPYTPIVYDLEHGLDQEKLMMLREDPEGFIQKLVAHIELAREYTGHPGNLRYKQFGGI